MFTLNQEKCTKCGICAAVCPNGIIQMKDKNAYPTQNEDAYKTCINCGHCQSVCPQAALSLEAMPLEECSKVPNKWCLSEEQLEIHFRGRRTVRNFKNRSVEREKLEKIINICRYAPSSFNSQPVNWVIAYDKEEVNKIREMAIDFLGYFKKKEGASPEGRYAALLLKDAENGVDPIIRGAPQIVFTHVHQSDRVALTDGAVALTYMELLLPCFGLAGCWAGYLNTAAALWPPLKNALNIPKSHIATGAIVIGYPEYRYYRFPLRNDPNTTWL